MMRGRAARRDPFNVGGATRLEMELEERTIEQLPDRCENCGAKLTDAEKQAALTEGPPSGLVLCTTCASEVVPVEEPDEEEPAP